MKTLIVYYSYSGITKSCGEIFAEIMKGDLLELIPEKPYSFHYNTAVKEIRREIERGICPKLISKDIEIIDYDLILIGSPNWLKTFAPPVRTFLRKKDWKDKKILPFCTHGGGGLGRMEEEIKRECPEAEVLLGMAFDSGFSKEDIENQLRKRCIL